jgi:hypothetical protein
MPKQLFARTCADLRGLARTCADLRGLARTCADLLGLGNPTSPKCVAKECLGHVWMQFGQFGANIQTIADPSLNIAI